MHAKLESRFNRLNAKLNSLLKAMDGCSDERLLKAPEGKWNSLQILHHLLSSEQKSSNYIHKKMQGIQESPKTGMSAAFRSWALRFALGSRIKKYKAPAILGEMPENLDYTSTKENYLHVRKELAELLKDLSEDQLGLALFKHPIAGRMNVLQALGFMEAHMDRHGEQIYERAGIK